MERQEIGFAVTPINIILNKSDDLVRFTVKNTSNRSCHYEIFTPDVQHFKIVTPRTFTLAPGITKLIKIQHLISIKCSHLAQVIHVVDTYGRRINIQCQCFKQELIQIKKIEVNRDVQVERLKVGQQKLLEVPVRNICNSNLKIKAKYSMIENFQGKINFKIEQEQLILLKGSFKKLKVTLKLLKEVEFQFWLILQCVEEETRNRWEQHIRISGNSLMRSQFIADTDFNRVDFLNHEMLNGTHYSGSVFLMNNYHEDCPYKLLEVMEISDYKSYLERLEEITLRLGEKQGFVEAKGKRQIHYTLETRPNQNDLSFTSRYSQLTVKDEASSYKLRNSNYFKKNLQILIRVQFGEDNPIIFKLKVHVVNVALKISRTTGKMSDNIQIINDSGLEIPYKFNNNLYYNVKTQKGKLKSGINNLEIEWRKEELTSGKTKENSAESLRCTVKMEIPKNQVIIYEPVALQRPKTAMLRSGSVSKQNLRERISLRAPSRTGEVGIRGLKEVNKNDFLQKPAKFMKGEDFEDEQFKFLQINQNEKGNILTNSHKTKKVVAFFPEKGYLLLQNQHSYLFAFQKKSLRFELCGRAFLIKSRQIQDKNPFKITKKELLFCFSQGQKEFDIIREVEVVNKSNEELMMYCLSVDDEYFHSIEADHKISIPPKATNTFKLSFFPKAEIRLREGKIMRNIEFLINNSKETIICEGDFLSADIQIDEKELNFKNCRYSSDEMTKQLTLINKGLNKISFLMEHSELIKMTPRIGSVSQKCSQIIMLSFIPAKLPKIYKEDIKIYIKGSHLLIIPLKVNTLEPDIQCLEEVIDFREGYINQTLSAAITILNRNPYACTVNIQLANFSIIGPKTIQLQPGEKKSIDLKFIIREIGEQCIELPNNFIELVGYGAIKGPQQYCYIGKKTLLQIIPQNPFQNLVFSQIQQTKSFKIKNLSKSSTNIKLLLSPQPEQHMIIVSCEPNMVSLASGEERQFKLYSIRVDQQKFKDQPCYYKFNLTLLIKSNELYRSIDFQICLPPPQLEIQPKNAYFPLVAVGTWSKCSLKIINKGYKEVLIAIKKPVNIAFELDYKLQRDNRLTKLNNLTEVTLLFKSKKTVSFGVPLDIEDNFGKKYQVKLFGTSSNSPLLNCQRTISSSSKGFSSKEIRSTSSPSFNSTTFFQHNDELQNVRFINKWFHSILPQFSKDNENFNNWLKNPRHLSSLLTYLRCEVSLQGKEDLTLECILEELKKNGFPLYTVQIDKLIEGDQSQWTLFMWFLLSHETVSSDCLKWVNKTCGINIQTYENAYNHHKKILMDLFSRLFGPIFKGKVTEWQKISQCLEPSFPILAKIDNKRQFILVLNILYHKFSKMEKEKLVTSIFQHDIHLQSDTRETKSYWVLGNNWYEAGTSSNGHNLKYSVDKKTLNFMMQGSGSLSVKIKDDLSLVIWNNSFYDSAVLYELEINKKAPHLHNICIECEDKCSQEWKLEFLCEFQAEYFFQFSGGLEFKCKMPDLGIIKAGEILQFRVIYSPNNLKEHSGVLKISNKYEQHVYNLKGKPLRSNLVELERLIKVPQGQKFTQTFSIAEDTAVCNELSVYKVTELGQKSVELKSTQAKSNKKQIIVQVVLEFARVIHQQEILLQVANEQLTFSKNIRLIINVIPKPVVVQAQIRGVIDKVISERIPITNPLPTKQNCFVTLHKITKEDCLSFNKISLQNEQLSAPCTERGDWEFKLNQTGKICLKPHEKVNVQLSYTPVTLTESCCQIRIKLDGSENIIVYNFLGVPELPYTDNPPILLTCEAEQSFSHSIKISNRLKQRVNFDVQTNLSFIAGAEQITIGSRQSYNYSFKILALHTGSFEGQLIFKSEKFYLIYPITVNVVTRKKIRKIKIQSKIRITSTIQIELANRSDKDVEYEVYCNSCYLTFQNRLVITANSQKALILHYTPLFQGTKMTELKLYNEHMQEIVYNLEMVSEEHKEICNFNSELAEKKKVIITIKNPTSIAAKLEEPKLPRQLNCQLNPDQFPLPLPAYGIIALELVYTQFKLQNHYKYAMQLCTAEIGNFCYQLNFTTAISKKMAATIIHYESNTTQQTIDKECYLQFLNCYDENLNIKLLTPFLQLNARSKMKIEGTEEIQLKPYEKRRLKCQILIKQGDITQTESNEDDASKLVVIECKEFSWMFPMEVVKVINMPTVIQIIGSSHELAKARISLKKVKGIKDWIISDFADFRDSCHLSFISSREVYLEAIINKNFQYSGSVMFYDQDMSCAEKYPLNIKIGGKKYQKIWIAANVGEKGRVEIRLKNGRGHYKVELKNNKMKEFGVDPMEGDFIDKGDNAIFFEYNPTEYNGNKKAEVSVTSDSGCFNFFLLGKFPNSK